MSFSDAEDDREDSSSPPARRAILLTCAHFWWASDVVRLKPTPFASADVLEERGWGVVRARNWASFTAFAKQCQRHYFERREGKTR